MLILPSSCYTCECSHCQLCYLFNQSRITYYLVQTRSGMCREKAGLKAFFSPPPPNQIFLSASPLAVRVQGFGMVGYLTKGVFVSVLLPTSWQQFHQGLLPSECFRDWCRDLFWLTLVQRKISSLISWLLSKVKCCLLLLLLLFIVVRTHSRLQRGFWWNAMLQVEVNLTLLGENHRQNL